jgi:hypothetical protein
MKERHKEESGNSLWVAVSAWDLRRAGNAGPDPLTWAVCRYCSIKYQSWAGVSSNRNWKPAEVIQGGSPGSVLETEKDSHGERQKKFTLPTCPLTLFMHISGCTLLGPPFSVNTLLSPDTQFVWHPRR